MKKTFSIPINVYPFNLIFSFNQSDKALNKTLKKYNVDCKNDCLLQNYEGFYIPFGNGISLIRLRKFPKNVYWLSVLIHEITHAVIDILRQVGVKLSEKSEEAYTYLMEYITHECLKQIKWK